MLLIINSTKKFFPVFTTFKLSFPSLLILEETEGPKEFVKPFKIFLSFQVYIWTNLANFIL